MKSQTKINKQVQKKTDNSLKELVIAMKKKSHWKPVAEILAGPRRHWMNLNIQKVSDLAKNGETIVVPGKVLSLGELDKKITIIAVNFSKQAAYKIKKSGSEALTMHEGFNKHKEGKEIKIFKW